MKVLAPDSPPILLRSKISMEEVRKLSLSTPSEVAFQISSDWVFLSPSSPCSTAPSEDGIASLQHKSALDLLDLGLPNVSSMERARPVSQDTTKSSDDTEQKPTVTIELEDKDDPITVPSSSTPAQLLSATETHEVYLLPSSYGPPCEVTMPSVLTILTLQWDYGLQKYIREDEEFSDHHEILQLYRWQYPYAPISPELREHAAQIVMTEKIVKELRESMRRAGAVAAWAQVAEKEEIEEGPMAGEESIEGLWEEVEEGKRECDIAAAEYEDVVEGHRVENLEEEEGIGYCTLCQMYEDSPHYRV